MIDHQIVFDERYESEVYQTVTLYFTCPKEFLFDVLKNEFPDAVSAELSIELPISDLEARYATVCNPLVAAMSLSYQTILIQRKILRFVQTMRCQE